MERSESVNVQLFLVSSSTCCLSFSLLLLFFFGEKSFKDAIFYSFCLVQGSACKSKNILHCFEEVQDPFYLGYLING